VPSNSILSCNNKVLKPSFQKPSKKVGHLATEIAGEELAAQFCKVMMEERKTRGPIRNCG